ncbi:APC family permease [Pelosinus propionicus]|uniref:Serine/threonine exchange transporter, LAT family n=1 Tax=Pelosinus propionicus DSM 13327 TaxID=1123291 RepID=A0A1I4PU75_9FIRM|nr:amino acid permease [Pelosinus propionicus]SFM31317.1 serine/threonine exchange transporter, LAT family [Pelosinus propionicus DSM 13327]
MAEGQSNLQKNLGLMPAMALVIGMVIGSGIFMKSGSVILAAGDSTMALMAWILGGSITLAAGLTVSELGVQIPKTGGLYTYLNEVYGKMWAYLYGWMQTVIYGPATIGALGLYFSSLLLPFFGISEEFKLPIAVGSVFFMTAVNCLGTKYGGFIQTVATIGKLIPIALIVVVGLWKGNGQILGMTSGVTPPLGMGAAILATLWAYDGWVGVSFVAGEMKNPAKQLPKAIVFGLGIVMLAYLAMNMAIMHVLPAAEIAALGKMAASTTAGLLFGEMGGKIISIGILVSIFGALNGYILTNGRVPYAMALNEQLPISSFLSKVPKSVGTPVNAMLLEATLATALMIFWDPDSLTDIAMFVMWTFYVSAFIAVFILRKRYPTTKRSYSVPAYPVIPMIAILGAFYIIVSMFMNKPMDAIVAIGITLVGLPIYWFTK